MPKFQSAEKTVQNEAKSALMVYALSGEFLHDEAAFKTPVEDYVTDVVNKEWELFGKREFSETAKDTQE